MYSLVHTSARMSARDKTEDSLVAHPGTTVEGGKHITSSPCQPEHPVTVDQQYNTVPAILWPPILPYRQGHNRYTCIYMGFIPIE